MLVNLRPRAAVIRWRGELATVRRYPAVLSLLHQFWASGLGWRPPTAMISGALASEAAKPPTSRLWERRLLVYCEKKKHDITVFTTVRAASRGS